MRVRRVCMTKERDGKMTEFTISLAGVGIGVSALYETTKRFCEAYLTEAETAFTVVMEREDIAYERRKTAQEAALEGLPEQDFSDGYLETLALYRKLAKGMLGYDAVVFHGSVLAYEGRAYLFTALSGTGKTTHSRLWLKNIPGCHILNGDKPLLRVTAEGVFACGTPWQGKEGYGRNEILPLEAICILERDSRNHIEPVSFREGMNTLIQQTNRPGETALLLKTLDLIGKIGGGVKLYRLGCNMEDEAAFVSFEGMRADRG